MEDSSDATDRTVNVRRVVCNNDDINNELSNEDRQAAVDNDIISKESIDSLGSEEEAVNQIVTQISGSPSSLSFHYWTLIVVLLTMLIIQH